MKHLLLAVRGYALLCLFATSPLKAQTTPIGTLSGAVLDPSGAAISRASVHLHSDAADRDVTADQLGRFTIDLPTGVYDLTVEATGFRPYTQLGLLVKGQRNAALTLTLPIASDMQEVNVTPEASLSNDASSNKSALVFKGDQLDTFSDDASVMQQQLLALGGSDPTNPPQIYVDGFSNGTMPPKESIREIRINQNPMSAQFDQFGGGRIEIFTKPGSNQLHGSVQAAFGNSALNGRNPYAGTQPGYNNNYSNANVNGPLGKKSSFYLSARTSSLSSNAVINAVTLDAGLNQVAVSLAVPNNVTSRNYSLRLDRQFGAKDTFIGRYTFSEDHEPTAGIGQLVLASQASASNSRSQTLQLTDTHVFGPHVVFDSAVQYIRTRLKQDAVSSAPSIVVEGAFSGGGSPSQSLHDNLDRLELQEYFSVAHNTHFVRTGMRYRLTRDANLATAGYNGQYVFADIATYRAAQQDVKAGLNGQAIKAAGHGPTQFSLSRGIASASLATGDIGVYAEDEWKATPNLTLNYGLRIESQTAIPDHFDLAPRVAFAYSIKRGAKAKDPIAVVRGGLGIFYQRFASGNILQSLRQNGTTQQVYFVANPDFYATLNSDPAAAPLIPGLASLTATPTTIYQVSPNLTSPMQFQGMVSVEHSFGKLGNMAASYYQRRSTHQFESLNVNAPLPGSGVRPLGGLQNVYQYASDGIGNGYTFTANANINVGKKLNGFLFAAIGHQEGDTNGPSTFASNSYDVGADAGRLAGYGARQIYSGINARPGWNTAINIFVATRSSSSFNITTGQDNNDDTIYNDRPAFATDLTRASVVKTAYGNFDTAPLPGQTIIPINYGDAPGIIYMELYVNKSFYFGPRPAAPTPAAGAKIPPVAGAAKPELPPKRYRLMFSVGADNVLNHVNAGTPVGVLTSPFFGRSISLNNSFSNTTAANRFVTLRTSFYF